MDENTIIVLIVFGSIFGFLVVSQLISLAKKWIDRKNSSYDEEAFERLAKAFIQHKKDSERRFQNLEAIITDMEPKSTAKVASNKKLDKTQLHNTIELDTDEEKNNDKGKESGGNLRNMLKE